MVLTLREKCPNAEFFWSVFSRIRNEFGEILRISPDTGKHEQGKISYLDTVPAVQVKQNEKSQGKDMIRI